jgi:hypothetical protein
MGPQLDLDYHIYLYCSCPSCKAVQYIPIDNVNFCTDIDIEAREGRYVDAWIETGCMACGQKLERNLARENLDADKN